MQEIDFSGSCAAQVGMRVSLKILEKWGCNQQQVQVLLKLPENYKNLDFKKVSFCQEQAERASYILNIHAGLSALFNNPNNIYGFMSMANHHQFFNGKKPIEVILKDDNHNLQLVMEHIDQLLIR